jgi:hypothetical protein
MLGKTSSSLIEFGENAKTRARFNWATNACQIQECKVYHFTRRLVDSDARCPSRSLRCQLSISSDLRQRRSQDIVAYSVDSPHVEKAVRVNYFTCTIKKFVHKANWAIATVMESAASILGSISCGQQRFLTTASAKSFSIIFLRDSCKLLFPTSRRLLSICPRC